MTVGEKLSLLRKELKRERLAAFIFPGTDPHNGEYVPGHWKGLEWISGFTGSAGTAVVTMTSAALWTDSRYFIAAGEQLRGTEFVLMKQGTEGTPAMAVWLGRQLRDSREKEAGIDGTLATYDGICSLKKELRENGGLMLRTNFDPLERIWKDRPEIPAAPVTIHPLRYAGETAESKIARTRAALRALHADGTIVTSLDDVAWLLNLRGSDVPCNPVFVGYLLITSRSVTLFTDGDRLSPGVADYLEKAGVTVKEYDRTAKALASYPDYSILVDGASVNYRMASAVKCKHVIYGTSPVPALKAVKNETEIRGFKSAMLRDGAAMVKFLRWIAGAVGKGGVTEISAARKLTSLRAEGELFAGLSFDTIAGYGEHGAIVHYGATEESDRELRPEGFLLLDSGAQYLDGTTDITRTIPLGPLSDEERRAFTLVLKGHIAIETAVFPEGTTGTQLDALARMPMWKEGMNFLHGTGHGVGSYLCVHEGPHQIRTQWVPSPLESGMTVTDEPGLYFPGRFGVRIENTLLVREHGRTEFGRFLSMEALTLCPIATSPVIKEMLSPEETAWINAYHEKVLSSLAPLLEGEDRKWLEENTRPI